MKAEYLKPKYSYSGWNVQKINILIILLANFASFDWSIRGPITYGKDGDGPVTFAFFCFFSISTLFELVINEMANHFGLDKRSLGLGIGLF